MSEKQTNKQKKALSSEVKVHILFYTLFGIGVL